ncbi:uncharacterized protein BJ171DRAFT_569766 [Polychytrium aggregatum]|uniref:uncharacterized protein n=1 Tax=Polychytrium aggregatum TaxID=110093 RepID=UPI0022FE5356|nr:uncharacterized protein BJ171DRAFT_569766 [Polychytrium aggregatum]KAI9202359.1 hypothetical protein BJ171DRAFT_569766 [Polychytrium aggregatum]
MHSGCHRGAPPPRQSAFRICALPSPPSSLASIFRLPSHLLPPPPPPSNPPHYSHPICIATAMADAKRPIPRSIQSTVSGAFLFVTDSELRGASDVSDEGKNAHFFISNHPEFVTLRSRATGDYLAADQDHNLYFTETIYNENARWIRNVASDVQKTAEDKRDEVYKVTYKSYNGRYLHARPLNLTESVFKRLRQLQNQDSPNSPDLQYGWLGYLSEKEEWFWERNAEVAVEPSKEDIQAGVLDEAQLEHVAVVSAANDIKDEVQEQQGVKLQVEDPKPEPPTTSAEAQEKKDDEQAAQTQQIENDEKSNAAASAPAAAPVVSQTEMATAAAASASTAA